MHTRPQLSHVYQTLTKSTLCLLFLFLGLVSACDQSTESQIEGEWRLSATKRVATFGGRADRITVPKDVIIPVYYNIKSDGTYSAESPRNTTLGNWTYEPQSKIIILKSTENLADTILVTEAESSIKLELTKHTAQGEIITTYSKED